MKHPVLVLAFAFPLVLAMGAYAQVPPEVANSTPEQRAELETQLMKEKLKLDDTQLPKVQAINLQIAQKMEPVLKGSGGPLVKARALRAAEQERETALKGVLTPAQMQQFQAAQEEIKEKVEQRLMEKRSGGETSSP